MAECENHLELAALQHVIAMAKEPDENGNRLICRIGNDELVLRPIEPAPAKDKPRDVVSVNLDYLAAQMGARDGYDTEKLHELLVAMAASIKVLWEKVDNA